METATLDDLMAMNEQLAALAAAGVPIDVGLEGRLTPDALGRINAAFARGVSRGETLASAVEQRNENEHVPIAYQSIVQAALQEGNLPAALERRAPVAELAEKSRSTLRLALFYPLIVCTLAYVGFVALCVYVVPIIESAVVGLEATPGPGLRALQFLRETLPAWVAVPPLILLTTFVWSWQRNRRARSEGKVTGWVTWLPAVSQATFAERCATFASTLAALLAGGSSLEAALDLAAGACGDRRLKTGAQELAAGLRAGKPPAETSSAATSFPPFLRWALWKANADTGQLSAVEMAASLYHRLAQQRLARLRLTLPLLACVLVGGGATFLYGIALFLPVAEMLQSLAR